jgi:hypothetical protein
MPHLHLHTSRHHWNSAELPEEQSMLQLVCIYKIMRYVAAVGRIRNSSFINCQFLNTACSQGVLPSVYSSATFASP